MQCHIHLKYVLCIFPVAVAVAAHLDVIDFICYGLFLIHRIRNGYIVVGVIVLWTTQKEEQNKPNDATRIENVFFPFFAILFLYTYFIFDQFDFSAELGFWINET